MIHLVIIAVLSLGTIYNLIRAAEIDVSAELQKSTIISIVILSAILIYSCIYILEYNIYNYYVSFMVILFTVSGLRTKGMNKKGVFTSGILTYLAKFYPWRKLKAMKFEFNKDDFIDVVFVTDLSAFKQRYKLEYEDRLIKIKKELKLK